MYSVLKNLSPQYALFVLIYRTSSIKSQIIKCDVRGTMLGGGGEGGVKYVKTWMKI